MRFSSKLLRNFRQVFHAIQSFTWRTLFPLPKLSRKKQSPETLTVYPSSNADGEILFEHNWNVLEGGDDERYASLADLCFHVGEQLPTQVVKLVARDVLRELEHHYEAHGVAHGDLNTQNIILSSRDMKALVTQISAQSPASPPPSQTSLDLFLDVNSMLTSTSSPVFRLSRTVMGRLGFDLDMLADRTSLKAPEVILGAPCDTSTDLWSLGCILYELLSGERLFDPSFQTEELGLTMEESHLIQIIELFGAFPVDLLNAGEHSSRWFSESGQLKLETNYYPESLEVLLRSLLDDGDVVPTTSFLTLLLQICPHDRGRARDLINHPWFTS